MGGVYKYVCGCVCVLLKVLQTDNIQVETYLCVYSLYFIQLLGVCNGLLL